MEAAEVKQVWSQHIAAAKNGFLALPAKLAPRIAACSDVAACHAMLDKEIRQVLTALSHYQAK